MQVVGYGAALWTGSRKPVRLTGPACLRLGKGHRNCLQRPVKGPLSRQVVGRVQADGVLWRARHGVTATGRASSRMDRRFSRMEQ